MQEWVQDNATQILGAVVALLITAVGVLTAEGGRRRRELRRVKEELEVLALVEETAGRTSADSDTELRDLAIALRTSASRRLGVYLMPDLRRLLRSAGKLSSVIVAAALGVVLFDLADVAFNNGEVSEPTTAFLASFLFGSVVALSILLLAAIFVGGRELVRDLRGRPPAESDETADQPRVVERTEER